MLHTIIAGELRLLFGCLLQHRKGGNIGIASVIVLCDTNVVYLVVLSVVLLLVRLFVISLFCCVFHLCILSLLLLNTYIYIYIYIHTRVNK